MFDEDDFMNDNVNNNLTKTNESSHKDDYIVEQRATERLLNELTTNGYRDARQKFAEEEKLIQLGFDIGYQQLVKLAFLTGQIRSICSNYPNLKSDSAFLARLNDKLEKIEKLNYEKLINWKVKNNHDHENVEPCLNDLRIVIIDIENKLNQFKNLLFQIIKTNHKTKIIDLINEHLESLEIDKSVKEKIEENDLKENSNLAINDLIKSFNI